MITYTDLSDEQRQLYLKALIATAKADDQLDEDEISFFTQVAEGVGIEAEAAEAMIKAEVTLDTTQIPSLRSSVGALILRDIAAMAVVNSDLVEKEELMIFEIGKAMQFTEEEVEEFLNWAFMGLQWQLKSTTLLEKYASPK